MISDQSAAFASYEVGENGAEMKKRTGLFTWVKGSSPLFVSLFCD